MASNQSVWTSPLANWPPAMWRFVIVTDSTTHAPRMWHPDAPLVPPRLSPPPPSFHTMRWGVKATRNSYTIFNNKICHMWRWLGFICFSIFSLFFFCRILCVLVLWALSILSVVAATTVAECKQICEHDAVNTVQTPPPPAPKLDDCRWGHPLL